MTVKKVEIADRLIGRHVCSAGACLYRSTLGFLFARNRSLLSTLCLYFGHVRKPKPIVEEVKLSEIIPGDGEIQIHAVAGQDGNISLLEMAVTARLIKLYNPGKIFEIGTFDGRTTLNMAANCSEETKIYTLDLPKDELHSTVLPLAHGDKGFIDKEVSGSRYSGTDYEKKITQLYGDSARFDLSPFLNAMDFVFIDGSHSYEYVLNDSKQALKLLRNGQGVILWHDYGKWKGVTRALNELYSEVNEFKAAQHIEKTSLVCLIMDGQERGIQ